MLYKWFRSPLTFIYSIGFYDIQGFFATIYSKIAVVLYLISVRETISIIYNIINMHISFNYLKAFNIIVHIYTQFNHIMHCII